MRPPLSSSRNRRPERAAVDAAFVRVASSKVMVSPFEFTVACRCRRLGRAFLCFRYGAAGVQAVDVLGVESEFAEDRVIVLAETRPALRPLLGDAMHLDRTGDRRGQFAAGAFERNDDVVCGELRIVDYLLRPAHG